jgi:site-specific DNA recombinase
MADRLFDQERLTTMLVTLASRRAEKAAVVDARSAALEKDAQEADERLRRLYQLVETNLAVMDDILRDRITALKADRDRAHAALDRIRSAAQAPVEITPLMVGRFGQTMRENLTTAEIPFRKAYIGSIVDRIEVDDCKVRIIGRKDVLEQAVVAGASAPGVRSFVRKWRARQDQKSSEKRRFFKVFMKIGTSVRVFSVRAD